MPPTPYTLVDTDLGQCALAWSDQGITRLQLPERTVAATESRLQAAGGEVATRRPRWVVHASRALREHLGGRSAALDEIPVDVSHTPPFHQRAYEALRAVPLGFTVTYGELAARIGAPGAARAIGQAVGANPVPVVIPCHRVISTDGLGGFSAPGGIATKETLLALEGVRSTHVAGLGYDPKKAIRHLRQADERLGQLIRDVGGFGLEIRRLSVYESLLRAIVYQQLAGRAAAAIFGRVRGLVRGRSLLPEAVDALTTDALRGAGLSQSKTHAVQDLTRRTLQGEIPTKQRLRFMSDEAAIQTLTKVRGIGRWTAEMLLIGLGRPDVLPATDYGVQQGFGIVFKRGRLPKPTEILRRGERWRPYRSVASWYLWRAVDTQLALDV